MYAYIVMAYIVMACIVTAYGTSRENVPRTAVAIYSYGKYGFVAVQVCCARPYTYVGP